MDLDKAAQPVCPSFEQKQKERPVLIETKCLAYATMEHDVQQVLDNSSCCSDGVIFNYQIGLWTLFQRIPSVLLITSISEINHFKVILTN